MHSFCSPDARLWNYSYWLFPEYGKDVRETRRRFHRTRTRYSIPPSLPSSPSTGSRATIFYYRSYGFHSTPYRPDIVLEHRAIFTSRLAKRASDRKDCHYGNTRFQMYVRCIRKLKGVKYFKLTEVCFSIVFVVRFRSGSRSIDCSRSPSCLHRTVSRLWTKTW